MLTISDNAQDHDPQDRGPRHVAAIPARLCVATSEVKPIADMIRFVIGPERIVVPDIKRKLPGRGVWVTARQSVLADAVRRNVFRRGFKADVEVSQNLPDLVDQLLERSVLDALAMARKAGAVIAGFAKIESAIESQEIVALLQARDASGDGHRKIISALKRRFGDDHERIVMMSGFASAQLSLALARSNVVHAVLLAERPSDAVLARWRVLERFRTSDPEPTTP